MSRYDLPENPLYRKSLWVKRKRYSSSANDADPVNKRASEAHAETYRGEGVAKANVELKRAGAAHDERGDWLVRHRHHKGSDCLFLPRSRPGVAETIRFNFKTIIAARAMCILTNGLPPTPKHQAIHSCGNGHLSCVNPAHLRWGTAAENREDAIRHGRSKGRVSVSKTWEDDPSKPANSVAIEQMVTADMVAARRKQ